MISSRCAICPHHNPALAHICVRLLARCNRLRYRPIASTRECCIHMTYDNRAEPRLVLPFLRPFYERLVPLSWLVIRATAGLLLFVQGYPKLGHVDAVAANMAKSGLEPALLV